MSDKETYNRKQAFDALRSCVATMIGGIEEQITALHEGISERNALLFERIRGYTPKIRQINAEVMQRCINMLAQETDLPDDDLRFVVCSWKAGFNIEKIALFLDETAFFLQGKMFVQEGGGQIFGHIVELVLEQINQTINLYLRSVDEGFDNIGVQQKQIKQLCTSLLKEVLEKIDRDDSGVDRILYWVSILKNLEKVSSFVTDIGNTLYYQIHGTAPTKK